MKIAYPTHLAQEICTFSNKIAYLLKKGIAYPFFFSHIFSILKYPIKVLKVKCSQPRTTGT